MKKSKAFDMTINESDLTATAGSYIIQMLISRIRENMCLVAKSNFLSMLNTVSSHCLCWVLQHEILVWSTVIMKASRPFVTGMFLHTVQSWFYKY